MCAKERHACRIALSSIWIKRCPSEHCGHTASRRVTAILRQQGFDRLGKGWQYLSFLCTLASCSLLKTHNTPFKGTDSVIGCRTAPSTYIRIIFGTPTFPRPCFEMFSITNLFLAILLSMHWTLSPYPQEAESRATSAKPTWRSYSRTLPLHAGHQQQRYSVP